MVIEKLITELRKRIDHATPDQLPIYQEILDLAYSLMDEPVAEDLEQASDDYVKSTLVGSPSIKKNAFKVRKPNKYKIIGAKNMITLIHIIKLLNPL